jgi:hypothetical protein
MRFEPVKMSLVVQAIALTEKQDMKRWRAVTHRPLNRRCSLGLTRDLQRCETGGIRPTLRGPAVMPRRQLMVSALWT